jgi:hypothetical protein
MDEIIFNVEEAAEGGYTARALGHSIFTEADTIAELHEMVRDAVRCYFEVKSSGSILFAMKLSPYEASPRSFGRRPRQSS